MANVPAVTEEDIVTFQTDGALCLRGVIDEKWIELLRKGIAYNRVHPSEMARRKGHTPLFFHDYGNWRTVPEYEAFIFDSPVSEIAGRILQSSRVALYSNHTIVKDSGSMRETPWHHDQAYYEIEGDQVCSIWVPVDEVSKQTCLRLVKGSHKWLHYFKPVHFDGPPFTSYRIKAGQEEDAYQFLPAPDVAADEKYDVLCWDMKPGDCIIFHMKTVHGAHGNNLATPRRAFSTRWLGDDAVKGNRPWADLPPSPEIQGLEFGANLVNSGVFPVAWNGGKS